MFYLFCQSARFVADLNKWALHLYELAYRFGALITGAIAVWEILRLIYRKVKGKPAPRCD